MLKRPLEEAGDAGGDRGRGLRVLFADLMPIRYDPETPYRAPLGGTQSAVAYLLPTLAALGMEVTLASVSEERKVCRGVLCEPAKSLADIQRLLCETAPDLLVSVGDPAILIGTSLAWGSFRWSESEPPPILACTCGGTRCLSSARVLWMPHDTNVGSLRAQMPLLPACCDAYVFLSTYQRGRFCREIGIPEACTTILRHGISPAFEGDASARASAGERQKRAPRVAYCSTPFRGLSVLLDLFPRIRSEVPDVELHVFSSLATYQIEDPPAFQALYERARAMPGVILRGAVGQEELAAALAEMDVLAYPNYFPETFCVIALEAAAAGCEIVTTDLGALRETLLQALGPSHAAAVDLLPFALERSFATPNDYMSHLVSADEMGEPYAESFVAAVARRLRRAGEEGDGIARSNRAADVVQRSTYARVADQWAVFLQSLTATAQVQARRWRGVGMHLQLLFDIGVAAAREGNFQLACRASELALQSLPPAAPDPEGISQDSALMLRWLRGVAHLNAGGACFKEEGDASEAARQHMVAASEVARLAQKSHGASSGPWLAGMRENAFLASRNLFLTSTGEEKAQSAERALGFRFDPELAEQLAGHYEDTYQLGRAAGLHSQVMLASTSPRLLVPAHNGLAHLLKCLFDHEGAERHYQRAYGLATGGVETLVLSNLILNRCYHEDEVRSNPIILELAREWGKKFSPPSAAPGQIEPVRSSPEGKLRVGYLSSDFRVHPVGSMLGALLRNHDRSAVTLYCYNATPTDKRDAGSELFEQLPDIAWRNVQTRTADEIARAIREDRLDVLIEMMGHVVFARLDALRPGIAPVIASYFAYPATTGIPAVDVKLVDGFVCPEGGPEEPFFTERLHRLPHLQCFEPWPDQRAGMRVEKRVHPYAASPRPVRFGNFNNPHKFTRRAVACWAEILRRVPESSLTMRFSLLQDPLVRSRLAAAFAERGVGEDRLNLGYARTTGEYFDTYNEIDIALDTFPYGGGMTSSEALWYATPLVTLSGSSYRSRVGGSLLTALGHPELIAKDEMEYVDIAVALARDPGRLRAYHDSLHEEMRRSPLGDGAQFTRQMEDSLRAITRAKGR